MKKRMNANVMKSIAILAMTGDHIAWMLYPGYPTDFVPVMLHIIGRLTCPIMCYCVAEGYHYTKDIRRYTGRLFLFAGISHFAYIFAAGDFAGWMSFVPFCHGGILNQTSVMWPLAWGLVMLRVAYSGKISDSMKPLLIVLLCVVTFPSDWSCIASLCILAFGTNRGNLKAQMLWMLFYVSLYSLVYSFALDKVYGIMQMGVALSIPIIMMYNGKRSGGKTFNRVMKWLFYAYYPLHLLIIGLFRLI